MSVYDFYITPEEYAAAGENGISRKCLTVRIRQLGWNKRRAMTEPPQKQSPRSEWLDMAKANGIQPGTFWDRVKRRGWEPERAATTMSTSADDSLKAANRVRRRFSEDIHALRKANGIPYTTFVHRVCESGWDEYRAATEPAWTRQQISQAGRKASRVNNDDLFIRRNKKCKIATT